MSLLVEYPAALPCPQRANWSALERRARASETRPREARALQRDRGAVQAITFPPMSAAEFAAFRAWWRDDLVFGGRWFVAGWPNVESAATKVYRFLAAPQWSFVPGGRFTISAQVEIRGAGLDPVRAPATLFLAHFDGSTFEEVTAANLSGVPSSYAAAPEPFGSEAVFTGGQGLAQSRPGVNFLNRDQWQVDLWLTLDNPTARSFKSVLDLSTYNGTTRRVLMLIGVASGSADVNVQVWNSGAPGGAGGQTLNPVSLGARVISETARTHVRVVRDGGSVTQWHDGALVAQITDPYSFDPADAYTDERVFIGAQGSNLLTPGGSIAGFVAYFWGRIDEVRFATELTDVGAFTPPDRPFTI